MRISKSHLIWSGIFLLLFIVGMIGGYLYFFRRQEIPFHNSGFEKEEGIYDADLSLVKIYYPLKDRLIMEEKMVKGQASTPAMASSILMEFLKGSSRQQGSLIPQGARLLNTFMGKDGILYIDLSDEIRRNFQGDAYAEFLLLKGIYESIISNLSGVEDVKILVEGKEIESLGGHISILYPLKNTVASVMGEE